MPNVKVDYKKALAKIDYKKAVAAISTGVFIIYKELNDSVSVTDNTFMSIGKTFADTIGATDAGSLKMQNYCAIDYFADDYVGLSLTF